MITMGDGDEEIVPANVVAMILGFILGWLLVRLLLDTVQKSRMDHIAYQRTVIRCIAEAKDADTRSILNDCISATARRDGITSFDGSRIWVGPRKTPSEVEGVDRSNTDPSIS